MAQECPKGSRSSYLTSHRKKITLRQKTEGDFSYPGLFHRCGHVVQEFLQTLLRHMLHDDDVGKVAAEPVVMIGGEIVFRRDGFRRALEIDGVRLFLPPYRPAHVSQLALQPCRAEQHPIGLLCESLRSDVLDDPPNLQRGESRTRAVDHRHAAVEIGDVERVLVLLDLHRRQEDACRLVDAEELMAADRDGVEGVEFAVHGVLEGRPRQITAEERRVHMTVNLDRRIFRQDLVDRVLIVDTALEGRAHRENDQRGTVGDQRLFKFLGNHAAMRVRWDEPEIEILQIHQPHIRVMGGVRHINDRLFLRLFLRLKILQLFLPLPLLFLQLSLPLAQPSF